MYIMHTVSYYAACIEFYKLRNRQCLRIERCFRWSSTLVYYLFKIQKTAKVEHLQRWYIQQWLDLYFIAKHSDSDDMWKNKHENSIRIIHRLVRYSGCRYLWWVKYFKFNYFATWKLEIWMAEILVSVLCS